MPAVSSCRSPNSLTCSPRERVTKLLLLSHPCFGFATEPDMALQANEDIREEAIEQGASWQGWRLDIVDPSGRVLLSIPLDPTFH
jgi:hypothetical protein